MLWGCEDLHEFAKEQVKAVLRRTTGEFCNIGLLADDAFEFGDDFNEDSSAFSEGFENFGFPRCQDCIGFC